MPKTLNELIEARYHADNELFAIKQKLELINNELIAAMMVQGITRANNPDIHMNVTLVTRPTLKITNDKELEAALTELGIPVPYKTTIDTAKIKEIGDRLKRDFPGIEVNESIYIQSKGTDK